MSINGDVATPVALASVIRIAVPEVLVAGTVMSKKSPVVMAAASKSKRSPVVREAAAMSMASAVAMVLDISIPPVPAVNTRPVLVVAFPMVMVFALAPVPISIAPVVPESMVKAAAVPELIVSAPVESDHVDAAAPVRVSATSLVREVAVPVKVALATPVPNAANARTNKQTEIYFKTLVLIMYGNRYELFIIPIPPFLIMHL